MCSVIKEYKALTLMQQDLIKNLEEQSRLREGMILKQAKIIKILEGLLSEQALNKVS